MSLKEQLKKEIEDFIFSLKLKNSSSISRISIFENLINSFNQVLGKEQREGNTEYQNLLKELEYLKGLNEENFKIIDELKEGLKNFNGLYALKENEIQLKIIEKKALLRFKNQKYQENQEHSNSLISQIEELSQKKEELINEENMLKNELVSYFKTYCENIVEKNFDVLKEGIDKYHFVSELSQDLSLYENRDYIQSDDYAQSTNSMKNYLNKLFNYKAFVESKIKEFDFNAGFEDFKDKIYKIDASLIELNKRITAIEVEKEKAAMALKKDDDLKKEITELEEELKSFTGLLEDDAELQDKANDIRNYIKKIANIPQDN